MNILFSWLKRKFITTRQENEVPTRPFNFIRYTDPVFLVNLLQREHPQTIAFILSYMEPSKASIILENLPNDMRSDVVYRIACMGRVKPEILRIVERALEKKLPLLSKEDFTVTGGFKSALDILNLVDTSLGKRIIEELEDEDSELAEAIKNASPKRGGLQK